MSDQVTVRFNSTLPRHNRVLTKADFARLGVDHAKIDVNAGETTEVSQEAADALVELGDFSIVDPEEATKTVKPQLDDSSLTQSGQLESAPGGQSSTGSNTRDGAGARSATINR